MIRWILTALIATSCSFIPPYQRTVDGLPDNWREESDNSPTIANIDWWKQLNDPVLNELILESLDNNKDLKTAIVRVYQYYDQVGIARSFLWPEVDQGGFFERQECRPWLRPFSIPLTSHALLIFTISAPF